jgi:hypothetical protein
MAVTPTKAKRGATSTFWIEGVTPGVYVKVAEVARIKPPGFSRGAEDASHLESPDDYKEYIAGMKEMTDSTFTMNWVPAESDVMIAAFEADLGNYQIVAPDGHRLQFTGFFTGYDIGDLTPEGKMTADVTIKVTHKAELLAAV